jgi:hypothetical protein
MMTYQDAGAARSAPPDGTCEAARAGRHAAELGTLIDAGTLSPDGQAAAHGALALTSAVLALRTTIAAASAGVAVAVTGMNETLEVIAGAVTDAVTGDLDMPALTPAAGGVL